MASMTAQTSLDDKAEFQEFQLGVQKRKFIYVYESGRSPPMAQSHY